MREEGESIIVCAAILWHSAGYTITMHDNVTAMDYVGILRDRVLLLCRRFAEVVIYQHDRAPIQTAHVVQQFSLAISSAHLCLINIQDKHPR